MRSSVSEKEATVAGTDEVGRGPLAGEVFAAAVVLDPYRQVSGLADSKKLSETKRAILYQEIVAKAKSWSVASATIEEIDQLNILHASLLAMKRAVDGLKVKPDIVMVDGNRLPDWEYPSEAIVGGDAKVDCISAASIVAKVTRDRKMVELASLYPEYGFENHKGYPTRSHLQALEKLGPSPVHRRSFKPVKQMLLEL